MSPSARIQFDRRSFEARVSRPVEVAYKYHKAVLHAISQRYSVAIFSGETNTNTYEIKTDKSLKMQDKTMCEFSAYVAFNKATNGQTDIKHEKGLSYGSCTTSAVDLGYRGCRNYTPPPSMVQQTDLSDTFLARVSLSNWPTNTTKQFCMRSQRYPVPLFYGDTNTTTYGFLFNVCG